MPPSTRRRVGDRTPANADRVAGVSGGGPVRATSVAPVIRIMWKPPDEVRVRTWLIVAAYVAWLVMATLVVGTGQ